jgi:hypothetical protein
MKSTLILMLLTWFFSIACLAGPASLTVRLSLQNSDEANLELFQQQLGDGTATQLVFEFADSSPASLFLSQTTSRTYSQNYPNGDFYYLIGDLSPTWGKSDYARFYNVAKLLGQKGFRTIVNVAAATSDIHEAARNANTTAIIWNSHGADDGTVFDIKDAEVPRDAFAKNKSARLRFVLFANCYGYNSIDYYHIGGSTLGVGWQGETDSDLFFSYLRSKDFLSDIKKAFGKSLKKK